MNVINTEVGENLTCFLTGSEDLLPSQLVEKYPGLLKLKAFKIGFRPHKAQVVRISGEVCEDNDLSLTGKIYMIESLGGWELITVKVENVLVKIQSGVKSDFELKETVMIKVNLDDIHFFDGQSLLRLQHESLIGPTLVS
jgi:ABC-type sugar transport system ATPase subunit